MPKVRFSGTVSGSDDPNRGPRATLLYHLFAGGWDIYNSNGDQRISLSNIEKKIIESDAFVFTPGATLEDLFKAVSIFVGYQTLDKNLSGKATVILNSDASWNPFFKLLDHLHALGTIRQDYRDFLMIAESPGDVLPILNRVRKTGLPDATDGHVALAPGWGGESFEQPLPENHNGNVCVFCSASMKNPDYLADGRRLGNLLAENRLGCVSGAGSSGAMGEVVGGAVEAGGWTGGSNVPHIIELEGLPEGLSSFWLRPDIYTRMEIMIQKSDAFVIFPGGAGTVQEMLALLILKEQNHPLMAGKPVFIFNRVDADGKAFWGPLIDLVSMMGSHVPFTTVDDLNALIPAIREKLAHRSPAD